MTCLADHLGTEFSPEEIGQCLSRKGLLSLELELSRRCDLRCIYCYASSGRALENELSLEEIKDIITQAIGLGVKKIIILGGGEPLLSPHLFEVIDFINSHNLIVDLFTNGLNVNDAVAAKLYAKEVGVVLKMNSRDPEIQDLLAGKKGTFIKINQGLAALQRAGYPDDNHALGVETIICQPNYQELPKLWRWARQHGITPYIETMTLQGRAQEHGYLEVGPAKVKVLFDTLSQIDRDEFNLHWTPHPPLAASQCARHEYSCTVTSIGEIHPCPGVSVSTGNIRENSLTDILQQSSIIQELRNIRRTIKGQCASCDIQAQCYGCRGHAYQLTGDHLAEDPLCWLKGNHAKTGKSA